MKGFEAVGRSLAELLAGAFRPYIEARIAERGYPVVSSTVLDDAGDELKDRLDALIRKPATEQRRSPLEIFQAACAAPNAALLEMRVEPPDRDPTTANALPGDIFDLAPASSAEIGEEVWQAHLAWGVAKAATLKEELGHTTEGDLG
jgi:hypothetical protein